MKNYIAAVLLAITVAACTTTTDMTTSTASAPAAEAATIRPANPLLSDWTGSYGGFPPFDKVRVEDFKPALEAGMAENLANVDRIANDPASPTFENTIATLERASRTYDRVEAIYGIWSNNMNVGAFPAVEEEMEPKLAAFRDQITQNDKLF